MSIVTQQKKLTLYCTEGGSDKQYTLWIEEAGDGFAVNFTYGPRGGWVRPGTKTPRPVPIETAEKVYAKLLASKQAKGYRAGEDAPAFSDTAGAVDSGLRVMLPTAAPEEDLERFTADEAWGAQEKINGVHCAIIAQDGRVVGVNKRGLEMTIPAALGEALGGIPGRIELDGELVGSVYHLFDAMRTSGTDATATALKRIEAAARFVEVVPKTGVIRLVPLVVGTKAKRALVRRLKEGRKEGVVFKRLDAGYQPGKVASLSKAIAVKIKFYAEGNFIVLGWNKDRQSVSLGAYASPDGSGAPVSVGSVTIPDKYKRQMAPDAVVRIRYLYATPAKKLYQPTLSPTDDGSVVRTDMRQTDCLLSQLRFEGKDE